MTTARKKAYAKIRDAILGGKFPPGSHLKEEDLARLFHVSRTPVRQALRALATEGLVTIPSNRRTQVADVSERYFEEVFDVLAQLESYSAGLAAVRMTPEQLAKVKAIQAKLEEAVKLSDDNDQVFLDLNSQFHKAIHKACDNDKVYELILRIVDLPHNLYLKFRGLTESHSPKALSEHRQIIAALEAKDKPYAEMLMRSHVESVRRHYRQRWAAHGLQE